MDPLLIHSLIFINPPINIQFFPPKKRRNPIPGVPARRRMHKPLVLWGPGRMRRFEDVKGCGPRGLEISGLCKGIPRKYGQKYGINVPPF